jgi:hypothetical protein
MLNTNTDLSDCGVVKVDPCLEFGVEDEGGIVFAIVTHHGNQL